MIPLLLLILLFLLKVLFSGNISSPDYIFQCTQLLEFSKIFLNNILIQFFVDYSNTHLHFYEVMKCFWILVYKAYESQLVRLPILLRAVWVLWSFYPVRRIIVSSVFQWLGFIYTFFWCLYLNKLLITLVMDFLLLMEKFLRRL